jgi:hypothetical protein
MKKKISCHKVHKQQTTSFWSQRILEVKREHHVLFSLQDVIFSCKTKFLISFISLINIKQIKAFLESMALFYKRKF